jgi:dolichol-phosphate mannosyltransferase
MALQTTARSLPCVTVIVPCYNEEEGLDHLLQSLRAARQQHRGRCDLHFVMVDDGSHDDTLPRLEDAERDFPELTVVKHRQNSGITQAILTGLHAAQTETVVTLDADCTYDPCRIGDLLEFMQPGVDLVTASPYHPLGQVENIPPWRLKLSHTCSWMYRRVMRTRLWTYTSCFRAYRREAFLAFKPKHPGFVGLVEMIRWLEQQGGSIVECPATLRVRQFGQSKMRAARVAREHLRFMAGCCLPK